MFRKGIPVSKIRNNRNTKGNQYTEDSASPLHANIKGTPNGTSAAKEADRRTARKDPERCDAALPTAYSVPLRANRTNDIS